jgi:hypothetical protein
MGFFKWSGDSHERHWTCITVSWAKLNRSRSSTAYVAQIVQDGAWLISQLDLRRSRAARRQHENLSAPYFFPGTLFNRNLDLSSAIHRAIA